MPTVEQRLSTLEDRVAYLQDAYERNVEFIGKKLVEHAVRLDRIEDKVGALATKVDVLDRRVEALDRKVDGIAAGVSGFKAGMEALPAVIAQTIREEFARRDEARAS